MKHYQEVTVRENAKDYLEKLDRDSLVIYSPTSLAHIELDNINVHMIDSRVFGRNIAFMEALCKGHKQYNQLVSVGGGTATDVAKYIATKMDAKFICIPSMLSTNSYSTDKVALVVGSEKITLDAKLADCIILDASLVEKAPLQNLYGLADVLSIHTALLDWKRANKDIDESLDSVIYDMASKLLNETTEFILKTDSEQIRTNIEQIFKSVGESGHITNLYGSGRPESGSEHIFAKRVEKLVDVPHGVSVSLGIILMSLLQDNYSDQIALCIKKIGTLENLSGFGIGRSTLIKAFESLHPREDRYSIIDMIHLDDTYIQNVLNTFEEKTGIKLER